MCIYAPMMFGILRVESGIALTLKKKYPDIQFIYYEHGQNTYKLVPRHVVDYIDKTVYQNDQRLQVLPLVREEVKSKEANLNLLENDIVISVGFNWNSNVSNLSWFYQRKSTINFKFYSFCHDIIPLKFTHWIPGQQTVFAEHINGIVNHSDVVFCFSHSTEEDLVEWSFSKGIDIPKTAVIPMATEIKLNQGKVSEDLVGKLSQQPFILQVSSIETRKSQETITRAYMRLLEKGIIAMPLIVFVGLIGNGGGEFINLIRADHRISNRVIILEQASDSDLDWLYQNCLFTVFPSLYEGWGLPISESLTHGKFCIAGTGSSLHEAGGTFIEYADPWNIDAWAYLLYHYSTNREHLVRRECCIKKQYKPTNWEQTSETLINKISEEV